jgi:hypothetical protein
MEGNMLSDAIDDHQNIRDRLVKFISKEPFNAMDLFSVRRDYNCDLGSWLWKHRNAEIADKKEYQELVGIHHNFHEIAYKALMLGSDNKPEEAFAVLVGPYAVIEKQLIEAIVNLGDVE